MEWLLDKWKELKIIRFPFAQLGVFHWMRSLALLCDNNEFIQKLKKNYTPKKRNYDLTTDIYTVSHLLMSLHYLATLKEMSNSDENMACTYIRSAIISWYYGIYFSAKAMISATDGSQPETHKKTADIWDKQIAERGLAMLPFDYRVSNLIKKNCEEEIDKIPHSKYDNKLPKNEGDAIGFCCAYLKGTAQWYREKEEMAIKGRPEFKKKFNDFRNREAKSIRDNHLEKKRCGFIHQAYRFRGKANYRDELYLSYSLESWRAQVFLKDSHSVLMAFFQMAFIYCSRCVEENTWNNFLSDIQSNSHLKNLMTEIVTSIT